MNQKPSANDAPDYALLVLLSEKPPAILLNLVHLLMHYQFGLKVLFAYKADGISPILMEYGERLRCFIAIHDQQIETRKEFLVLNHRGEIPLFLLFPAPLLPPHQVLCEGLKNTHLCSWESLFKKTESSLQ